MAQTPAEKAALKRWYSQTKQSQEPGNINNPEFKIHVTHIPTGKKVDFKGWVTGFADNFQSQWTGTPVYGRMDDLYTFQKTSRRISLAFDVIAGDATEAIANVKSLNTLTQFLYPVYSDPVAKNPSSPSRNSQVLAAAPLLKLRWNSLARNAATGEELVGFLAGLIYQPVIDSGQFFAEGGAMAYQNHTVQLEFTVLHTHLTGWTKDGNKVTFGGSSEIQKNYPHGLGSAQAPKEPPGDTHMLAGVKGPEAPPGGYAPPTDAGGVAVNTDIDAWLKAGSPPPNSVVWNQKRLNDAANNNAAADEEEVTTRS